MISVWISTREAVDQPWSDPRQIKWKRPHTPKEGDRMQSPDGREWVVSATTPHSVHDSTGTWSGPCYRLDLIPRTMTYTKVVQPNIDVTSVSTVDNSAMTMEEYRQHRARLRAQAGVNYPTPETANGSDRHWCPNCHNKTVVYFPARSGTRAHYRCKSTSCGAAMDWAAVDDYEHRRRQKANTESIYTTPPTRTQP